MTNWRSAQAPLQALQPGARVHLIGVAGAGMNALAAVLLARGYSVSGSDMQRSAQVDRLVAHGLRFSQGHQAANIHGVDLVIISAAVRDSNVELAAAYAHALPVVKRAAALGWLLQGKRTLAVAGTHGKTTTSALLAVALRQGGLAPTFLVGGEVLDLEASAYWDTGIWAVVEADEYDRSFLHLRPAIAVITNVEPDHLEYYGSLEAMHEAYADFVAQILPGGTLVINADDPYLRGMAIPSHVAVVSCGIDPAPAQRATVDWYASAIVPDPEGMQFTVIDRSGRVAVPVLRTRLAGTHNVSNALQAFVAAHLVGVDPLDFAAALARFRGAGRRFQVVGDWHDILIIDDYAHHPTEVRANLTAAKERFPQSRLVVVFQPHTYSRTKLLFDEFVAAFDVADLLVVTAIYAARETDTLGVDAAHLCAAIAAHPGAPSVSLVDDLTAVPEWLAPRLRPGDVVLTLGAGSITTLGPQLLEALRRSHG